MRKIILIIVVSCLPVIQLLCEENLMIDRLADINGVISYRSKSNEYICLAYTKFDEFTGEEFKIESNFEIDGYIINSETEEFIMVYSNTKNKVVVFDDSSGPFLAAVTWDLNSKFIVFDYGTSHLSRLFSAYNLDDGRHVVFPYDFWLNRKGNTTHRIWYSNEKKLFGIHYAIPLNADEEYIDTFSEYSIGLKVINWNGDSVETISAIHPEELKIETFNESLCYSSNQNDEIIKIDF